MVIEQLVRRGIRDPRVLEAMSASCRAIGSSIRRWSSKAYEDRPLSIGYGQTISQPYMVARATELAAPGATDRALEVGAGCGYQAAVLARALPPRCSPSRSSRRWRSGRAASSREIGCDNATVESFDGSGGWPEHAPYDVIIVSAGAPRIPPLLVTSSPTADGW